MRRPRLPHRAPNPLPWLIVAASHVLSAVPDALPWSVNKKCRPVRELKVELKEKCETHSSQIMRTRTHITYIERIGESRTFKGSGTATSSKIIKISGKAFHVFRLHQHGVLALFCTTKWRNISEAAIRPVIGFFFLLALLLITLIHHLWALQLRIDHRRLVPESDGTFIHRILPRTTHLHGGYGPWQP